MWPPFFRGHIYIWRTTVRHDCPGMTSTCLIKLNDVLTICQSNFKMLSGALLPPTSTSHPSDIIHVIGVHRPSRFLATLLLLPCIILNANRKTKNGERPGNKAIVELWRQYICSETCRKAMKAGFSHYLMLNVEHCGAGLSEQWIAVLFG